MRKALFLLLFVAAGVAFALAIGNRAASASTLPVPLLGQEQSATNHNQTTQDAAADATTRQANVNLPISVLSFGSNNGDVSQHNQANTDATARNSNDTRQGVDQHQNAKADGSRGTSSGSRDGAISQDQSAANDNSTDQRSEASATTRQLNVNAPISVLSFGSNNGDVRQGNDGTTSATAKNDNGTAQKVDQDQKAASKSGRDGRVSQSQDAKNGNETDQSSDATATTKQVNVNAPISLLGFGVNNGNVDQHNSADTSATAKNSNGTDQTVDQNQSAIVDGPHRDSWDNWSSPSKRDRGAAGSIDQQQSGTNDNRTEQSADASALTKQKNVNAPISVLSLGSDGYGVDGCGCSKAGSGGNGVVQRNGAVTTANAGNDNWTGQKIDQDQQATVVPAKADHRDRTYPHRPRHHKPEPCACEHHPQPVPGPCGCEHHPKPVPDRCGCEHQPAPYPSWEEALIGRR